ncbi:membrane dipeptidase, partial [Streptomyces mirabilis]|uniref:membrane dipeptidase n=1 Tax=Streptomyces mirabilis TaxID=68239 RepID=UPI003321D44F
MPELSRADRTATVACSNLLGPYGAWGDLMSSGFADLHNHQFAHLGFGGMAFWGGAYGDIAQELGWCTSVHGPGGTGDLLGNIMRSIAYGAGGGAVLGHRVGGYPQFDGWPRWDSITHQAVFEDWLKRAVDGGLHLMVMLAVNNEYLCGLANKLPNRSCNDMEAVNLQLQAAKDMETYVDAKNGGPGSGWYRIVRTPEEAKAVIAQGKLAVILGIEVDYLFNCRNEQDLNEDQLARELDRYFDLGVRYIFPIHFSNNGFGGTAFQNALIRSTGGGPISGRNPLGTIGAYTVQTENAQALGYAYRTGRRNVQGLTDLGKALVRGLISRGMVIDIDHMSAYAKADVLDICEQLDCPVVSGHSGFIDISLGDKRHEGQLLDIEIERVRNLGGMINPIVRQGNLTEIRAAGTILPLPHFCGASSNSFAQAYLYAINKMAGMPTGIGTDFNGFAGLPGPRFGPDACPGGRGQGEASPEVTYPFTAAATGTVMDRSMVGDKTFDINTDGLAHVGMLPDFIADLEAQGITGKLLDPLLNSADGYAALWAKAWSKADWSLPGGIPAQGDDMQPGEVLLPGQSITSGDGRYTFIYQGDGNLVLYGPGGALWSSATAGTTPGVCIMQADGNLVIYEPGGKPVWDSGTFDNPGSHLVVQGDANVVIYRPDNTPAWSTATSVPTGPSAQGDDMQPGEVLLPGQSITSGDGRYTFIYQG